MTEQGEKLLIEVEGSQCTLYHDHIGLPTIGVGHLLTRDEIYSGKIWIGEQCLDYRKGLTEEQVKQLMYADLAPREAELRKLVFVPLTENQFDALVSFAFNIGINAFKKSTLLKTLNKGEYALVPGQMRRWVFAGGKKSMGLANRREKEIKLWNQA